MSDVVHSAQVLPATKKCVVCAGWFPVQAGEQRWKTHCDQCYESMDHRKCTTCDRNLPPGAKKWAKICTACWLKKREATHDFCPLCVGERATQRRKKISDALCKECTILAVNSLSADPLNEKPAPSPQNGAGGSDPAGTSASNDGRGGHDGSSRAPAQSPHSRTSPVKRKAEEAELTGGSGILDKDDLNKLSMDELRAKIRRRIEEKHALELEARLLREETARIERERSK
jgi:hypothetical protein